VSAPHILNEALAVQYTALREGVGAYRLARDVVSVWGPDAPEYLQGQCSQDVLSLSPGDSNDGLLLSPDGKLVALVRMLRVEVDRFTLDVTAGFGEAVVERLNRFSLRSKVDVAPLRWSCIALRGAGVGALSSAGSPAAYALRVAWNGTAGVDVLGEAPEAWVPESATWCDRAAWEALRVEAGIPDMGTELDGRTIPAEAHLLERAVNFDKGCYTGQELVARMDARGNRVARRLMGIVPAAGATPEDLVGADLRAPERADPVGVCTSAAWCPGLGGAAALAYVHRSVAAGATVTVVARGGELSADVRDLPMVEPRD